jgi:hypothetical protein
LFDPSANAQLKAAEFPARCQNKALNMKPETKSENAKYLLIENPLEKIVQPNSNSTFRFKKF